MSNKVYKYMQDTYYFSAGVKTANFSILPDFEDLIEQRRLREKGINDEFFKNMIDFGKKLEKLLSSEAIQTKERKTQELSENIYLFKNHLAQTRLMERWDYKEYKVDFFRLKIKNYKQRVNVDSMLKENEIFQNIWTNAQILSQREYYNTKKVNFNLEHDGIESFIVKNNFIRGQEID